MIKIEHTEVFGWEAAIRGMRNPMNSWCKSDSAYCGESWDLKPNNCDGCCSKCEREEMFIAGPNDLKLMKTLVKAGSDHSKFMRMITVTCDITCHHTWWAEFDTYKVGTVRNSCSKMHKIHVKEFTLDDFSIDDFYIEDEGISLKDCFINVVADCEMLRKKFNETNDRRYWKGLIELLPMGYNIKATVQLNYAVLRNMYHSRKGHKLDEWHTFCDWVKTLPYSELITGEGK